MTDAFVGDFSRQEEYDDIVRWVTLNDLKFKIGCSGQQLKILNRDLPTGQVGTPYSVDVYPDSSLPVGFGATYRWCVQPAAVIPGLTFNPAVTSANCVGLAENLWGLADRLSIAGTPTAAAPSQPYTIFLRDNADPAGGTNDNIAQKNFVLTINP